MEKKEARRLIRQAVAKLSMAEREEYSGAISERLLALPEAHRAGCVMAYLPMADELDTRPFLAALLAEGKRVYVPRTILAGHRMLPVRLHSLDDLTVGFYSIAEPRGDETCAVEELDFLLVPGRGFDRAGNRVGRGAGFYDRFMATDGFRAVRCGAAFSCQVMAHVPHDDYDIPVEVLVTEQETLRLCKSRPT